jgi:hypothetical protein
MRRLTDTGRALVLPADISIPEAYILGYKEAVEEFLQDLYALPRGADYIQNKLHILCQKWEKILDK